jgi:hypothetical protein
MPTAGKPTGRFAIRTLPPARLSLLTPLVINGIKGYDYRAPTPLLIRHVASNFHFGTPSLVS